MTDKIKLTRFGAEWCNPCQQLGRQLASLNVNIPYIDIDSAVGLDLVARLNIKSVPALAVEGAGGVEVITGNAIIKYVRDNLEAIKNVN